MNRFLGACPLAWIVLYNLKIENNKFKKITFFSLDLLISFRKGVFHKLFHSPFVYLSFKIVKDRSGGGEDVT